MIRLAARSLRSDLGRFVATFVTIALSTTVTAAFATLGETALGPMSALDREILIILGGVIGGWGAIIGTFAPVSTLAMIVERRTGELSLLRQLGATPAQTTRLVQLETLVVAAVAAAIGAVGAIWLGRYLFDILQGGGIVAPTIAYAAGPLSLGTTALVMVALALAAATLATRRIAHRPAQDSDSEKRPLPRWRINTGLVLLGFGVSGAISGIAMSVFSNDPYMAMQISGPAGLLAAAGCATLSPALLGRSSIADRYLGHGTLTRLANHNTGQRPYLMSPVLGPVTLLMAGATGTLMLVGIDARTAANYGGSAAQADSLVLLNTAVAAMITIFTGILAVNAQYAVITARTSEFARLRLAGATPRQVQRLVTLESLRVGVLGAILGGLCAILTIVPMSWTRGEGIVPDGLLWLPIVVVAFVIGLTVVSARIALAASHPRDPRTLVADAA